MRSISFDLDGVLIQNPFAKGVFPRMRAHLRQSPQLSPLSPEEADARIDAAVRRRWGERMAAGEFVAAYDWDATFAAVAAELGGGAPPDVAALVENYCQDPEMIALLPGALECLEALSREGYRLYAATNGYHAYQWPVLEALGVARHFAALLTPDRLGCAKPDPHFFAGVPGLVLHVGDTLVHDVLGAKLAGLAAVWVAPQLPEKLRVLPPTERPRHPAFGDLLEASLAATPYREYHPEADLENCWPGAAVLGANEVPAAVQALLARPDAMLKPR